jgi:hypothetical protein
MSNSSYVRVKFFWKDGFEDEHEVPRYFPLEYSRRLETRGGKREDIVPGYTAVKFHRVSTETVRPWVYMEV